VAVARPITPASERSPADPPLEVQVSVVVSRRGRTLREAIAQGTLLTRGRAIALMAVAIAAAVAILALAALQGSGTGSAGSANASQVRDAGAERVSGAYRATCLTVAFESADRSHTRARPDRVIRCWPYGF
jgi:hypothetical protein